MCVNYPEGNCTPHTTVFNARTYAKYEKNRTGWISSLFSHQCPQSMVRIKRRPSKWVVKLVSFELSTKVTCCLCGWHCPSAQESVQSEWENGRAGAVKCDKYLNATLWRAFMFIQQLALLCACVCVNWQRIVSWVLCAGHVEQICRMSLIDVGELHAYLCYRFHCSSSRSKRAS